MVYDFCPENHLVLFKSLAIGIVYFIKYSFSDLMHMCITVIVTNTDFNSSLSDVSKLKCISNYMFTFSFAFICKKSN